MVGIWPSIEAMRRVKDMLDAMDDKRPVGRIGERDNTFDAQKIRTMRLPQKIEKQAPAVRIERTLVA